MNYLTYKARGGAVAAPQLMQLLQGLSQQGPPQYHSAGGQPTTGPYISHGTGAPGRADNIDAKLSENEYVIDAETMALLGDGNPDAGAQKMDEFRESVRRHKGKYLTHGKISPNALDPMSYIDIGSKK